MLGNKHLAAKLHGLPSPSRSCPAELDASPVGYPTCDTPERLLKPVQAAYVLGVTVKQMAIWQSKRGGPCFIQISHKVVMYRHQALLGWAREREFGSAHEARLGKT
jgi:hypothetical protein